MKERKKGKREKREKGKENVIIDNDNNVTIGGGDNRIFGRRMEEL